VNAAARLVGALAAIAALAAAAAPVLDAAPPAGRHTAQLCVATSANAPSCGPALVDLNADGSLRMRVDDVVYQLRLRGSQVEVIVMHNVVQIDEFSAPCEWVGNSLQFNDTERHSRYEIRFPTMKR
jgi:hypothetical protein